MRSSKTIPDAERLIFALDVSDIEQAKALADELGEAVQFYKLGLELMMTGHYFELVDWLAARGKKVFADLKLYDIPATVAAAVRGLNGRGVTFTTVHGNQSIMKAAAEAKRDLKILAVTVLTSLDRGDLKELGYTGEVEQLVLSRAQGAFDAGCDGVISSGREVPLLREHIDPRLVVVTPGIRPIADRAVGDQKRVVTVEQAFENGADYIVVGRPIRDVDQPREAAESIQATIAKVFAEAVA